MTMLIGTEKQINWAAEIMERVTSQINTAIETTEFSEKNIVKVNEIKIDMQNNQAVFWINTFKTDNDMFEYLNDKGVTGRKIAKTINENNGF